MMPWRWWRWVWFAVVPLGLAMYFLSAVPVERWIQQKLRLPRGMITTVRTIYEPAYLLSEHSDTAAAVTDWEHRLMNQLLGERPAQFGGFNLISLDAPADGLEAISETLE